MGVGAGGISCQMCNKMSLAGGQDTSSEEWDTK